MTGEVSATGHKADAPEAGGFSSRAPGFAARLQEEGVR